MFAAAGWQVITVKFGELLEALFARPGGAALRPGSTRCPTRSTSGCCGATPSRCAAAARRRPRRRPDRALIASLDDDALVGAIRNLGGHDLDALRAAFAQIDDTRPTVIIAYTIKGHGLPTQGHPQNHSSLLTVRAVRELAERLGADPADPWACLRRGQRRGQSCARRTAGGSAASEPAHRAPPAVPVDIGRTPTGTSTTQAALGRRSARPDPRGPGRGQTGRHRQPRRQLHHQPRRAG